MDEPGGPGTSDAGQTPVETSLTPGETGPESGSSAHVVVATVDSGTNPFHPCFRRPGQDASLTGIPGFPEDAMALPLEFGETYEESKAESQAALAATGAEALYYIPDTNLLYYGDPVDLLDNAAHGSQASSQIACEEYGMAPDSWLLIINWHLMTNWPEGTPNQSPDWGRLAMMIQWIAGQAWIDVVHLNIQEVLSPFHAEETEAIQTLIGSERLVVVAAGNGVAGYFVNYPTELSGYAGPPGVLVAGANENNGYIFYSNLDPHVVMDGCGTDAAEPNGFGTTQFDGTSSASPRVAGYVTELLRLIRVAYPGSARSADGLVILDGGMAPAQGPLMDGTLTVAELHEIIRKTADPNPHESRFDGTSCIYEEVPQPVDLPFSNYPKMGYGEVSEHTIDHALAVVLGQESMPERPVEDAFYERSEAIRNAYWGPEGG